MELMKKLIIALILFPSLCLAWTDDQFNNATVDAHWTEYTSGDNTISESGGYFNVNIGAAAHGYSGVKQTGISGEFDVQIKMCIPASYGPSWEINSSLHNIQLLVYIDTNNEAYARINIDPTVGENEVILAVEENGISNNNHGESVDATAAECHCARILRDSANDFYLYVDLDCASGWSELAAYESNPPVDRLNNSGDVSIQIEAQGSDGEAWRSDYITCTGAGCASVDYQSISFQ